jgi:hypothetical protein
VIDEKSSHRAEGIAALKAELHYHRAMKAGTTSLYHYLVQHPCIAPARNKELRFFDHRFHTYGLDWYWRRFPSVWEQKRVGARLGCKIKTGEASPYYLMHPHAPRRVKKVLPQVKLIVVLRNPVDRPVFDTISTISEGRLHRSGEQRAGCRVKPFV